MERLVRYIADLNGTVEIKGLEVNVIVPNSLSTQQLFEFGKYMHWWDTCSGSLLLFHFDRTIFSDNLITLKGELYPEK